MTNRTKPLSAARRTQLHYQRKKRCKNCGVLLSQRVPPCPGCRQRRTSTQTLCGICSHEHAHRTSSRKRAFLAAGTCAQCGQEPLALTSRTLGPACLQRQRQTTNQRRQQRRELGLCRECGLQAAPCVRCYWCRRKQWQPSPSHADMLSQMPPALAGRLERFMRRQAKLKA